MRSTPPPRLPPAGGRRSLTYYTLFGLLAATGLRVSKALLLKLEDVDFQQSVLAVRQTKFCRSRPVPLDATVVAALRRYAGARQRRCGGTRMGPFFVSECGTPPAACTMPGVFERLRAALGWAARGGHAQPRIHDLRHTFISRSLVRSYERRGAVVCVIDALSTYVGHARVSDCACRKSDSSQTPAEHTLQGGERPPQIRFSRRAGSPAGVVHPDGTRPG